MSNRHTEPDGQSTNSREQCTIMSQHRHESFGSIGEVDAEVVSELRDRLTEVSIKCSERCLYQSAKWYINL